MQHALVYHGAFESNRDRLTPGLATYVATDGKERPLALAPAGVDGLVIGYMERTGKRFVVVRIVFGGDDLAIATPVALDRLRHTGGRRLSGRPTVITDDEVSALLDDLIAANPTQERALALILNRVNQVRRGERGSIE